MSASMKGVISTGDDGLKRLSILGKQSIVIGHRFTPALAEDIATSISCSNFVIFTDSNIAKLHLEPLETALRDALAKKSSSDSPKRVLSYVLPPGESAKTRDTKAIAEDWMLSQKCTRDTCVIALGGGVIGDMCGFVAATFMRGVPFVQIPTTLLAMVDSSIGGKTAVDTPHGKNLIGAFHQPTRIFLDTQYLRTLPRREFVNGLAEVIKTAAIWDADDFDVLENRTDEILGLTDPKVAENAESIDSLLRVILGSAAVKAHIVTVDEKETGLRGLLNFGHSVGHAIEAILFPELLHGECVAIGMVKEAEIARHLGYLSDMSLGRLVRCLQAYGLPISLEDKLVTSRAPGKHCSVDALLDVMRVDKKNQGDKKRLVLLATIGKTVEEKATFVSDDVIRKILSPNVRVFSQRPENKRASTVARTISLQVPGSKSISNRALVLAALGQGKCKLTGLLHSDDVQYMLVALQKLVGIEYTWENNGSTLVIQGGAGRLRVPSSEVYLGNAGTASRFLTSVCALIPKSGETTDTQATVLTGNARMKQRPIGSLVDALLANGSKVEYVESKGCLPLRITPTGGLKGGHIRLSASISSQYVSSVLMAAPYAAEPVTLELIGDAVVSQPYIDMTTAMMESFGIKVDREAGTNIYRIPKGVYKNPDAYLVEADASSATYPLAFAAITGDTVVVTNMGSKSLQGDSEFAIKVLQRMGCKVEQTATSTTVTGPHELNALGDIDMESMTDAFLTASVLAGVATRPAAGSKEKESVSRITGIANQRVKECDRIAAMVEQLGRFGVKASELPDGIQITGTPRKSLRGPKGGVKCYDDHRVAMSFSVLACGLSGGQSAVVNEKKCVEKTWPSWWDTLENILGIRVDGVDDPPKKVVSTGFVNGKTKAQPTEELDDSTIIIVGMRGAGKTSMGRSLSARFQRTFIDMDEYLERTRQTTIPKVIETKGWPAFREMELQCLREVMNEYPKGHVASCGGGIVETADALALLKEYSGRTGGKRKGYVLHLRRDIDGVVEYLSIDKTRPAFGEDVRGVWERRRPLYEECADIEFRLPKMPTTARESWWVRMEGLLARRISFSLRKSSRPPVSEGGLLPTCFLSLTYSQIEEAIPNIDQLSEGVEALELRVDMLERAGEIDWVGDQVALLKAHTTLPIIFTVRTKGQGGAFADDAVEEMFELLHWGGRWGCEYIDVEVTDLDKRRRELTEALVSVKGQAQIIASYHDVAGKVPWAVSAGAAPSSMGEKYFELHRYADVVKLIGVARKVEDNFALREFVTNGIKKLGLPHKPLIAVNMGEQGRLSRALNEFLTPVTHRALPKAAAPGQLTVEEVNRIRHSIGLLPAREFFLCGEPISKSFSPLIHNTGFQVLGLPYTYGLRETTAWKTVKSEVDGLSARGRFGGASVTIPLKEDVFANVVEDMSDTARRIGSVNTLWNVQSKEKTIVFGDNTDWLGLVACIKKRLAKKGVRPGGKLVGTVLGAGGTARAAIVALESVGCKEVRVWNRTQKRAEGLAKALGNERVSVSATAKLVDAIPQEKDVVSIVIGTLPLAAQSELEWDGVFEGRTGVLVDAAYAASETPVISAAGKASGGEWECARGIEMLLEQGFEQFERWTGKAAPKAAIEKAVYASYDHSK
ncbi:EPSP synthase-domain-containing protein [Cladochytrium replicatum]|nr:EPSP synthase-domain-containing protein [Cladochytrium replicatum]